MNETLQVVAIAGASSDPYQLIRSVLGDTSLERVLAEASGRKVKVEFISWAQSSVNESDICIGSTEERSIIDRILARIGAARIHSLLQKFPIGRLLNSLSPWDQSRVFWRTVRRNGIAMATLESADVLLAMDLPAVRTAWEVRRRTPGLQAYYGLASISKVFAARFAQTASS